MVGVPFIGKEVSHNHSFTLNLGASRWLRGERYAQVYGFRVQSSFMHVAIELVVLMSAAHVEILPTKKIGECIVRVGMPAASSTVEDMLGFSERF